MALLLDGLSVTKPKGLNAGVPSSVSSFFSEALTIRVVRLFLAVNCFPVLSLVVDV